MRQSLCLAVASSIFLTRLVKGPLTSRAKIIATGLPPFFQTRHCLPPGVGPLTCSGLKGTITLLPTWGPDLRVPSAITPPTSSATAREAPTAIRFLIVETTSKRNHTDSGNHRATVLDEPERYFIQFYSAGQGSIIAPAGLDRPNRLNTTSTDTQAGAVQVHGSTAMGGDDLHGIADAHGGVGRLDRGMLLGQLGHAILAAALDLRGAEVAGDRLAAGVQHVPARRPANHGGQDG